MSDSARRTALLLGVVTVAAGLATISVLSSRKERVLASSTEDGLRSVSDTLDDCYSKLKDMQQKLSTIGPALHSAKG
ncbi:MAG: hypothetical protein ABJA67_02050 [Chthonomonadales bacterium]